MMVVLDTHVWFQWLAIPEVLPRPLREWLESLEDRLGVSAISPYELALHFERGRLKVQLSPEEWFGQALEAQGIELLPLLPEIALRAAQLPQIHRDPWDRLIIATALEYDAPLVTRDQTIPQYPGVRVIWDSVPRPNGDGEPA